MTPMLFRCPATGLMVQWHFDKDNRPDSDVERFEPIECLACGRIHLVNPETGRTAGARRD
jgi:hypothetical protein